MIQLLAGDCRDVLPTLAADSVQCVVTSPPYLGLRDYGTATWDGGDAACDHRGAPQRTRATLNANWGEGYADVKNAEARYPFRDTCGKCGATRIDRQIGLEATPDEYLATMVAVFREVRRVLRPDGTCWVNMGDSYASSTGSAGASMQSTLATKPTAAKTTALREQGSWSRNVGAAKPKDLLMMPARLALALQADGWWLRSDIIWHKPNPMPESVTDRCVSAHEHILMLTKSPRYFFDRDAIREPHAEPDRGKGELERNNWSVGCDRGSKPMVREYNPAGRSCRNVWTIATHAYPNAHFATYPPELAERCIRAGTSERGACSQCGAPWGRVVERIDQGWDGSRYGERAVAATGGAKSGGTAASTLGSSHGSLTGKHATTGWEPSCRCGTTETRPCVVLDPFAGAGTTLLVADRLQRDAIGIELSPDYTRMAMQRCQDDAPLFTAFPPASDDTYDSGMRDLFREAAD